MAAASGHSTLSYIFHGVSLAGVSELSRHKLSHYSFPDNTIGRVAQCELSRYVKWDWLSGAICNCGGFAVVGPAGKRYQSIAAQPWARIQQQRTIAGSLAFTGNFVGFAAVGPAGKKYQSIATQPQASIQ